MDDLISRSKLLKEIETWGGCVEALHEYISNMPTAYDVDAVVAELEYQKEKCEEDMEYWHEKSWKDSVAYTNWDLCNRKSNDLEEIIDIVRKGGVHE